MADTEDSRGGSSDVGAELRRLRTVRGLSLSAFADRVHYSKGYLSKLENGSKRVTTDIARACDEVLKTGGLLAELVASSVICPYPGLAAFDQDHAEWFFGREEKIDELLSMLTRRMAGTGPLIVAGPSGTGKSSLLRAGLVPAIGAGRFRGSPRRPCPVFTPTAQPVRALAVQLAELTGLDSEQVSDALLDDPARIVELLRRVPDLADPSTCPLLTVDQFEEAFTLCQDRRHRQVLVEALCAAAAGTDGVPAALVMLGLRDDFLGRCSSFPGLIAALRHGQLMLGAMTDVELRRAIEQPALAVGIALEPGLVEVMLRDLGQADGATDGAGYEPGALPLLSHALLETWRQRREGDPLTLAGYELVGGINGGIATTAERAYRSLDPDGQQVACSVLMRMIQLGERTTTRRQLSRIEIVAGPAADRTRAVLDTLIQARLLTAHGDTVEIIHEALLRDWPRLREWVQLDRAGLLLEQRLTEAALAWDREGRHDAGLYRGPRLEAATERVAAEDPILPPVARDFLRASIALREAEQHGVARRTRRLRQLVAALSVLVLVATVATAMAVLASNDVLAQRDEGLSREIAKSAVALRVSDPALGAQLALVALRVWPTAEARGALMSTAVALDPIRRTNKEGDLVIQTVAFNHDGTLLVAASRNKIAKVWAVGPEPSLATPPFAYLDHPGQVRSAAFDPMGRWLVTSGGDGRVRLWAIAGLGTTRVPVFEGQASGGPLAISDDGAVMATGGDSDVAFRLWDLRGAQPRPLPAVSRHGGAVYAVAFAPGGTTLATASLDGTIILWDVADPNSPRELRTLAPRGGFALSVGFSPDGQLLASGHQDSTVRLWDVADPRNPLPQSEVSGGFGSIYGVDFSSDSRMMATASTDTTARLWDVTDPAQVVPYATPLTGDADNMYAAVISPDNHTLASASYGATVHLWETDTARLASEVCAAAPAVITTQQWATYLRDLPYRPPCPDQSSVSAEPVEPSTLDSGATQLMAVHSGKCTAITGGAIASGAPALQLPCANGPGTTWSLTRDGDAFRIRNTSSGLCLSSSDDERKNGGSTTVVQRPCGEPGQLWRVQIVSRDADGASLRFTLIGQEIPDDCMNINGESTDDGAQVVRWPCGSQPADNALFRVSSAALPS
ncbi:MAG: RICIN domain-containing protein [Pseudonocardia sp.]